MAMGVAMAMAMAVAAGRFQLRRDSVQGVEKIAKTGTLPLTMRPLGKSVAN